MKLTKPILKQIIRESLEYEDTKKHIARLYINPHHRDQAIILAKSLEGMEDFPIGDDLRAVDLKGADLTGADLRGNNLSSMLLTRINLSDANLSNTNLSKSIALQANLSGANLSGANLSGTNLTGADLNGADLNGADLSNTILRYADLTNIEYNKHTIWPEGYTP